jgi:hypothetical protein
LQHYGKEKESSSKKEAPIVGLAASLSAANPLERKTADSSAVFLFPSRLEKNSFCATV